MATQPHGSPVGQGSPQQGHNGYSTEASTSSDELIPLARLDITPPLTPPRSPSVQESPSPTVDTTDDTDNTAALQLHHQCIIDMEFARDRVIAEPFRDIVRMFVFIIQRFAIALTDGLNQLVVAVGVVLGASLMSLLTLAHAIFCGILGFLIAMVSYTIYRHFILVYYRTPSKVTLRPGSANIPHYALIVCGSGGHTGEMIRMVMRTIHPDGRLHHRRWAMDYMDRLSFEKVISFERQLHDRFVDLDMNPGTFDIEFFTRGRAVHQSWITTPFTSILSVASILRILRYPPPCRSGPSFKFPGVVATNGPGTGLIFLCACQLLKIFRDVPEDFLQTIYIESWARVNSLSLTGKLVYFSGLADVFVAQHRALARRYRVAYSNNMFGTPSTPASII